MKMLTSSTSTLQSTFKWNMNFLSHYVNSNFGLRSVLLREFRNEIGRPGRIFQIGNLGIHTWRVFER